MTGSSRTDSLFERKKYGDRTYEYAGVSMRAERRGAHCGRVLVGQFQLRHHGAGRGLKHLSGSADESDQYDQRGTVCGAAGHHSGGHASGDGGDPVHYQSEIRADESVALAEAVRCGDVPGTAGHRVREY